ncbi:hypothetical protein TKK_0012275 [Trichogramma kaykai]
MPNRKFSNISTPHHSELSQSDDSDSENEIIVIPDPDNSGSDGDSASDDENSASVNRFHNVTYRSVLKNYSETQKKIGTRS